MKQIKKIGFGGGCHWCTEAVFLSLKGVEEVVQGWIASVGEKDTFSEAVIVYYNPKQISLEVLLEIHLRTHKSTLSHTMREKYRSAVYYFNEFDREVIQQILQQLQKKFEEKIITEVLSFAEFKPSREEIVNYYYKNPQKPFCENFINPKLKLLLKEYNLYAKTEQLKHLQRKN